ncbi:Nn.00g083100.m01.CDS01 [Neocucurbitaria sp. VM-36]
MHLPRTPSSQPRNDALHVTISFSIEITQEDARPGYHDTDGRATLAEVGRRTRQVSAPLLGEQSLHMMPNHENIQLLSQTAFTTDTLYRIAHNEMRNFGTLVFLPPEPPLEERIVPEVEVARVIKQEITNLATFGHRLSTLETLEEHANAIATGEFQFSLSTTTWMEDILPLRHLDKPLFHFLCDSLYSHTPQHIFVRWFALRKYLKATRQSLSDLLRQAEQVPRKKWLPLVRVLYFLLLDHNEALADSAPRIEQDDENVECIFSSYCAALRIRFYLWRMARVHLMCLLRNCKRSVKTRYLRYHNKQILNLITQEFSRLQEDYFQAIERRIVGEPVDITTITKPFYHTAAHFCSICQDTHEGAQCVVPLNCQCVFGRACLEPLLNRDSPSSYSCPNCRGRLHEPLKWEPLPADNERGLRIGLLWAIRSNAVCLKAPLYHVLGANGLPHPALATLDLDFPEDSGLLFPPEYSTELSLHSLINKIAGTSIRMPDDVERLVPDASDATASTSACPAPQEQPSSATKKGLEIRNPKVLLPESPGELRELDLQHLSYLTPSSRLNVMTDDDVVKEALKARRWLFQMLNWHGLSFDREREVRMFRAMAEKEMASEENEPAWTEMERVYMALTDYTLASPEERLQAAFALVLQLNFAERLKDVKDRARMSTQRIIRASAMDSAIDETRDKIAQKAMIVDHIACAVPFSSITPSVNPAVVDYHAGCCAICYSSCTALSTSSISDLLADFPVRIKHCGHIIGKACLEQWMDTPKIQEARYTDRTCPMCRIKIGGAKHTMMLRGVIDRLKHERRAIDTVKDLAYFWDMDSLGIVEAIARTMSEEIACEELMGEIKRRRSELGDDKAFEKEEVYLKERMNELSKEKWAWGFRGDAAWRPLRDFWMNSGVARKE